MNYLQEQYTFLRDGGFCSLESSEFRVIVLIPVSDRKGFFAHSAGKKIVLVYRLTRTTKFRAFLWLHKTAVLLLLLPVANHFFYVKTVAGWLPFSTPVREDA